MIIHSTGLGADEGTRPADDKIRGIRAISEFYRRITAPHILPRERKLIPIGKEGASWIASKKRLREHYARITGGAV
jgi:hypothetical protein